RARADARGSLARAGPEPGRRCPRHAPERARRRSQPQLPGDVAADWPAVERLLLRLAAVLGAGGPGRPRPDPPHPPAVHDLVPPAPRRRVGLRREHPCWPGLRAPRRHAPAPPALARRDRRELAEPPRPRRRELHRRATGGPARRERDPPPGRRSPAAPLRSTLV